MTLNRRLDDEARQLQVALVEPSVDDHGPLDEVDDLFEHAVRVGPPAERIERLHDLAPALGRIRLHARRPQRFEVGGRLRDLDRARREPVAVALLADDRVRVDHRERPANGARETEAAVVPAHRLREREAAQDGVHLLGKHLCDRFARHFDAERAVTLLELVDRDAVPLGEARGGLLPHRHRRAL